VAHAGHDVASQVAIIAEGVTKRFTSAGNLLALAGIDLSIRNGEFLSILGPSGCGKSTFLRCVAGLERITDGRLELHGQAITETPDRMGMVFQRDALLEWRTIEANIRLPLEFRGKDAAAYEAKIEDLLKMTGLEAFRKQLPRQLSGGMRQRAAICRALVDNPELLLMDEPFGALDALTREQMNVELQRICQARQNTVLFVTHGIAEAVYLSDRVAVFTPRPAQIAEIIDIDLPRPRPLSLRDTPRFIGYCQHIRGLFVNMGLLKEE
jgi:NitT/TauT family transport system ATP-binding protein